LGLFPPPPPLIEAMPVPALVIPYTLLAVVAFLIGSIPTGVIVSRLYRNVDVTQLGSQRSGATNVARSLGLGAGAVVLLGDLAKGALAVWLPLKLGLGAEGQGFAWVLAVLGHMHSVFLRGRGGRGVGTGLGGLIPISPPLFALAAIGGTLVVALSRYVSLGSLAGCVLTIVGGIAAHWAGMLPSELIPFLIVNPILVILAHRDNIERLRTGQERRFGERLHGAG
jgi:glycerol-3-phosphate acyltransferase PlsY